MVQYYHGVYVVHIWYSNTHHSTCMYTLWSLTCTGTCTCVCVHVCVCGGGGGGTCSTYVIHRYEGPRAVDVQVCWVYVVMHRYEGPRAVYVQVCWVYVVIHRYMYEGRCAGKTLQ